MNIIIDRIVSKSELAATLKRVEGFPNYVADNWDSIEECLASFISSSGEKIKIIHHFPMEAAQERMGSYLPILKDLQAEFPSFNVEFQ